MSDALLMELEATRCRLTQALRMHAEYRELTDLQQARIEYLEARKPTPAMSPGDAAVAPNAMRPPAPVAPAPARVFRGHDLVGPGGAVPTDEARRQQGLCQNPLCAVPPSPGRDYCSGGCATKHRWAEEKRLRKREPAPSDFRRIPPGGTIPIDRDRQRENLCQNPTCEGEPGAGGRYCSYSCVATHRNAVRRQQLDAAREPAGIGEIRPDQSPPQASEDRPVLPACSPQPAGGTLWSTERALILTTLAEHHGNRTHAARALGISIRTIRNKLREYRAMGDAC